MQTTALSSRAALLAGMGLVALALSLAVVYLVSPPDEQEAREVTFEEPPRPEVPAVVAPSLGEMPGPEAGEPQPARQPVAAAVEIVTRGDLQDLTLTDSTLKLIGAYWWLSLSLRNDSEQAWTRVIVDVQFFDHRDEIVHTAEPLFRRLEAGAQKTKRMSGPSSKRHRLSRIEISLSDRSYQGQR